MMCFDVLEEININNIEKILGVILKEYNLENATVVIYKKQNNPLKSNLSLFKAKDILDHNYKTFPIMYQCKEIGSINIPLSDIKDTQSVASLQKKIGLLINRHLTNTSLMHTLGKGHELIGSSKAILSIESFIERVSLVNCGVIIEGAPGSEILSVASAIHYNSDKQLKNFIELNCASISESYFHERLVKAVTKADGGTLFISDVDLLSEKNHNILLEYLCVTSIKSGCLLPGNRFSIRLIVSKSNTANNNDNSVRFFTYLTGNFNFLDINVPPLSSRKEDIPFIVEELLLEHKILTKQKFNFNATYVISQYDWPNNYIELERAVVKLMVHCQNECITVKDIEEKCPELLMSKYFYQDKSDLSIGLVENLKLKKFSVLDGIHMALKKSLIYISNNFTDRITLHLLADKSCVSPSHLSHLFKSQLGRSFKQILIDLRIEHAKYIFSTKPLEKITDVSYQVGFGDLSYFERSFKGRVSMTPRQYRAKAKPLTVGMQRRPIPYK